MLKPLLQKAIHAGHHLLAGLLCLTISIGPLSLAQQANEVSQRPIPSPPGKARLKGTVSGADGKPAGTGTVLLRRIGDQQILRVALGADGKFEAEGLVHGYYQVVFEIGGQAFPSNRVLLIPPQEKVKASFVLGGFLPEDRTLGLQPESPAPLVERPPAGVAHLEERTGPSGWAWFGTGRGVAVLIGAGTLFVAGLISLTNTEESVVSPSSP